MVQMLSTTCYLKRVTNLANVLKSVEEVVT
jgi:hypothetical protein